MSGVKGMKMRGRPPRGFSPTVAQLTRDRIDADVIIDRFQKHVAGKLKMTGSQIAAGVALLRKVVPDLQATDLNIAGSITTVVRKVYGAEQPPAAANGSRDTA